MVESAHSCSAGRSSLSSRSRRSVSVVNFLCVGDEAEESGRREA